MNQNFGLIGKKLGNTQIFTEDGNVLRVTAILVGPCTVLGKRTKEKDGYSAVILGFGERPAKHVRKSLAKQGSWMIVEPVAGDNVEDNINPVSRVYYAASTLICVAHSLSANGPALGAQAGVARPQRAKPRGMLFQSFEG